MELEHSLNINQVGGEIGVFGWIRVGYDAFTQEEGEGRVGGGGEKMQKRKKNV